MYFAHRILLLIRTQRLFNLHLIISEASEEAEPPFRPKTFDLDGIQVEIVVGIHMPDCNTISMIKAEIH